VLGTAVVAIQALSCDLVRFVVIEFFPSSCGSQIVDARCSRAQQ
jgi:hypothetical protein